MTAVEELREAARLMQERAKETVAQFATNEWGYTFVEAWTPAADAEDEHIRSWHPSVALAVAAWLLHEADAALPSTWSQGSAGHALTVARTYLGTSS